MNNKPQDLALLISNNLLEILKNSIIHDEIIDYIANSDFLNSNSSEEETIMALGSDGEFPITIHQAFGIYWITASEFDDIGYFESLEDAMDHAQDEYQPYISALREYEEEEEENDYFEEEEEEEENDEDDSDDK